jgi:THAP domain
MPRKCCIPGCKSNYQSFLRQNPTIATFPFPKDEALKQNWIDRIIDNTKATSFDATKSSGVCAQHFADTDIVKPEEITPDTNDVVYLTKTAVPRMFVAKEQTDTSKNDEGLYKKGARRCSVPFCKTNTTKILRTTKTETVYTFPKDLVGQTLWKEKLREVFPKMKVTPRTLVCIKHFEERFLSKQHVVENKRGGSVEVFPRKITSLVKHAYPTLFELPPEEEPQVEVNALDDPVKLDTEDDDDDSPTKKRRSSRKRRKPIKFEKILLKKIKKEPKTDVDEAPEPEEEAAAISDDEEFYDDDDESVPVKTPKVRGRRKGFGRIAKSAHNSDSWLKAEKMTDEEIARYEKLQVAKSVQQDAIVKFDQLLLNLHKIPKNNQWLVAKDSTFVKFFTVKQTMGPPIIDLSVCINRRLIIKIYRGRDELDFIKFSERAGCDGLKYSSIGKLLRFLCDPSNAEDNVERTLLEIENIDTEIEDFKEYVKGIERKFKDCVAFLEKQQHLTEPVTNIKIDPADIPRQIMKLKFLQYQLVSVFNKVTRYNDEFMEFCIEFFNTYPTATTFRCPAIAICS